MSALAQVRHWSEQYSDRRPGWKLGADGPDFYDCWSFVRYIWKTCAGIDVPVVDVQKESVLSYAQQIRGNDERSNWIQVSRPRDLDAVLLGKGKHPIHVGVWADVDGGGVMHCQEVMGVCFQTLSALRAHGWSHIMFYRHK